MEIGSQIGRGARFILVLVVLSPLMIAIAKLRSLSLPDLTELQTAGVHSLLQATLSATVSIFLGSLGAMGLLNLRRWRRTLDFIAMAPSLLPSLIVIVACLQVMKPFPFGLIGIVLVHAVVYGGLCARMIANAFELKLGAVAELSAIEGATSKQFLTKGALPMLKRDLLGLWLFVFVSCMTSFAIPLVVGGPEVSTLEVLIYEKALIENNISQAVSIGLLQSLLIFVLLTRVGSVDIPADRNISVARHYSWRWAITIPIGLSLIIGVGLVSGARLGLAQLEASGLGLSHLLLPAIGTLVVGLTVGIATLGLLLLYACGVPNRKFESFLKGYVSPSTALVGVTLMVLGGRALSEQGGLETLFKISFGLVLLMFTSLIRLGFSSTVEGLRKQWEQAQVLGSSIQATLLRVMIPQSLPSAYLLSGVAAFWACGDFALSGFFAGEDVTLGLIADSLLGAYRLEAAGLISILLLLLGGLCFLIFGELSRVSRKKLVS